MSHALAEAEQNTREGVLEPLPNHRNTALRPEENPNGSPSDIPMPPKPPDLISFPSLTPCSPSSAPQVAPTSTPAPLSSDAEFQIIEAELANCKMTLEALARREAVLRERKAEIIRETKMRLDKQVRELAVEEEEEEMSEALYMRNVQRRVEMKLSVANKNTNEVMEEKPQQVKEVKEEKVIPISAPERRRLARLALFKNDPRLG